MNSLAVLKVRNLKLCTQSNDAFESLFLEEFKSHVNVALGDMV